MRPIFEEFVAKHGLSDRVEFYAGDFFSDRLAQADVIIMGHILHDWDLAQKRLLLKRVHDALPQGGALIVYDAIIDDERRENAFGLLMSLNMLIETKGGFDYTGADCRGWMLEVGFSQTRVEHLVGPEFHGDRDQVRGAATREMCDYGNGWARFNPSTIRLQFNASTSDTSQRNQRFIRFIRPQAL